MAAFNNRRLRDWHLESGLTLEQVCVAAEPLSYSYLRALHDGRRRRPSIELLARLAAAYDRDLRELFTDQDADPAGVR
jgi:transcriptional regulator with XRE-family HTH domain